MFNDIPGKFIGLILAFLLVVVAPFVNTTVDTTMTERRQIINDVTNFMDEVVDTRQINDAMLKEFNANLSSHGAIVNYEIIHLRRSVNADPANPGSFYTSYFEVPEADNVFWQQGDRIQVHIWIIGYTPTQEIAHKLVNLFVSDFDITLTARIR